MQRCGKEQLGHRLIPWLSPGDRHYKQGNEQQTDLPELHEARGSRKQRIVSPEKGGVAGHSEVFHPVEVTGKF